MLLKITSYSELDKRKLMDIYSESNFENTDYFYPDESDKNTAVAMVETGFLTFLESEFFKMGKATYWVFEENGVWLSALRTCEIKERLYWLEALETKPECRGKGYGSKLLSAVLVAMKAVGEFCLCDCVSKNNAASLRTHEKCGFKIVSYEGYDYLHEESDSRDFGLEYRYSSD